MSLLPFVLLSLLATTTEHENHACSASTSAQPGHGQRGEHVPESDTALGYCSDADSVSRLALADGRKLGDLLDPKHTTIVLFYAPDDCFSCTGTLGRWIALGRGRKIDVILVFPSTSAWPRTRPDPGASA